MDQWQVKYPYVVKKRALGHDDELKRRFEYTVSHYYRGKRIDSLDNFIVLLGVQEIPMEEILEILKKNNVTVKGMDLAMMSRENGGIDLTSDKALTVQNNGQGIKFHIDPAELARWQAAPGVTFDIINIQPMDNLRQFLGLTEVPPKFNVR